MFTITFSETIQWQATIGDPTVMGWITVFAYFFTAAVSLKIYVSAQELFPQSTISTQKKFWLIIFMFMCFLGINKQLDLQSLLTAFGKYYAKSNGWYDQRRIVQVIAIKAIIASMLVAMTGFTFYFRKILKSNWLTIIGLTMLMIFIGSRATSFHHMDTLINTVVFNLRMNWVLELTSIFMIATPGILRIYTKSR